MSVADKINSIKTHVADAYAGIENKGGTIPSDKNIENLKAAIETISTGGSSGAELNIHYGDTAPEDTSKLWVKTAEPESVEISPDFGYGEVVQTTGVKSGFPTSTVTCEDGDYLYVVVSKTVKKYNKKTLEFISDVATLSTNSVQSILIYQGILYFIIGHFEDGQYADYFGVKLHSYDLKTNIENTLTGLLHHDGGHIKLYNNKIYIIGGGYNYYPHNGGSTGYYNGDAISIYDISLKTIEKIPFSYSYQKNNSVIIGNRAFVFGGYNNSNSSTVYNTISCVNLDTKTVTKCNAVLPIATYDMGVSNLGNYIYLSGGNKTSQAVYRYDTINDTIEQLNVTLEHPRYACATFFNDTELYLLGSNAIVDKLQIDVPLSNTKLKIISDWLNNQFAVVNNSSAKVMIGVNKAFKGDENNKAKEVTAYVFDGVNWHNLNGEITLTKLYAPKISISGKTLTITNDGRNGSHVTNYKVYNEGTLLTTITATTLDLTTVITANGTYNISVIATGTGYTDSNNSNVVEYNYAVYNIVTNLTGVTANASNPTTVSTVASSTLIFTPSTGYNLPSNITVTGAEFTWSNGTLVLSNPTGEVNITIVGSAIQRTITATLTNVTAASDNATTIATGETKTLTYTAADGYTLPDTVAVTGATGIWNKDTGTLTLSNPTANVTFAITGVLLSTLATPTISLVSGTTIQIDTIDDNATTIEVFADGLSIGEVPKQSSSSTSNTWVINEEPKLAPATGSETSYHANFKSNNKEYTRFVVEWANDPDHEKDAILIYTTATGPNTNAYNPLNEGWTNENYKTIEFTGTIPEDLQQWLNTNATQATPTTKQQIDLSTLSGWANLLYVSHVITVKAKANGYTDSAASNAVSVDKVASGHAVTVTAAAGSYGVKIYDGTSSNDTLLGTVDDATDGTAQSKIITCSSGNLYLISDNGAYTDANTMVTGGVTIVSEGSWYYNGTFKVTADGTITISLACLIEGTQITLADGTTKAIEDITYDDELLVWNFYEGKFDVAKPTWIKVAEVAPRYNLVKFSNGAEVGFVGAGGEKGYHRIFNKEAGAFTHTGCKDTPNGTITFAQDETFPTVISQEVVEKEVKFYNVITDKHYNLFANGILTSCRLSNKYRIEDMQYIGERLISDEQEKAYFERIGNKRK